MNIVPNSKVTFREYLDKLGQDVVSFSDEVFTSNWHSNPVRINELLDGIEWPDVTLSSAECARLNIPTNSTYADAVRTVRELRSQQTSM